MLKWTWLSGLASDWNIWEDELTVADMDAEHRFVPYVKEVQSLQNIYSLSEVKNADVLVGMDFSALLMLKSVKHRPVKQKWILLAPIIDFCHGEDAVSLLNLYSHIAYTRQNLAFHVVAHAYL